jgi:hypothetical protein
VVFHKPTAALAFMPLLLLLPLLLLALVALWLVLLPLTLWARYRAGRARRRAPGWVIRTNAWLLAASLPLFLLSAWAASHWAADALRDGVLGLLGGVLLGIVSLWLTRFEPDARSLVYTPSRWPALLLTTLVALRILASLWMTARHVAGHAQEAWMTWLEAGIWMGVAGLFLGYGLAYAWGLRARFGRIHR